MQTLSLWQEILLSLRFTDSIGHNIILCIIFLMTLGSIVFIISRIIGVSLYGNQVESKFANRPKSQLALMGIWMLIIPLGIFLFGDITFNRLSHAAALNDAFLYEVNGDPVAATVIEKFHANQIEHGMISGHTFYKIEAVDLKSGQLLFDKKLKGSIYGSDHVKMLCASQANLFIFLDSQIIAIDKMTGKTVRSIHSVDPSGQVLLLSDAKMCKYDQAAGAIIFKANDGLVYALDMNSFGVSGKKMNDAEKYFEEDDREKFDKNLGDGITLYKAAQEVNYYMFLTDMDIQNLQAGLKISDFGENAERRYLYLGNFDNVTALQKICPDSFLLGGFLFKRAHNERYVYDSIDSSNKNFANYTNISVRGESQGVEPFKMEGSNLSLIVHKKTIENMANILLTAIDLRDGQIAWTMDTGAYEIHQCYQVDREHLLLFCRNNSSMGDHMDTNYLLYVSIKDGSYTGYDFSNDYSFPGIKK